MFAYVCTLKVWIDHYSNNALYITSRRSSVAADRSSIDVPVKSSIRNTKSSQSTTSGSQAIIQAARAGS